MGVNRIRHAYIIYIDKPESIEYAKQCAESCEKYNMPYTLWPGVQRWDTREYLEQITGFKWTYHSNSGDSGCTASHLILWRLIAEQEHACCVFEHDAIVKHNIFDKEIPDDTLVMLGYRVAKAEDYEHPGDPIVFTEIKKFEGTHAYAISPNMAKHMIARMSDYYIPAFKGIDTTIDGILSIHDKFGIKRAIMDPPPAVCVVGDRISTIQGSPAAYNTNLSDGFKKGLKATPLKELP